MAGVAGLITLANQVSASTSRYVGSVKDAPKLAQELADELSLLESSLSSLQDFISLHPNNDVVPDSILSEALRLCHQSMTALSMKLPGLTEGKMNALGGRLKWPFTEKEIIKSLERLRKCAATFQFALTVEGCNVLKQTLDTATKGLQVQLDTSTKVAELAQSIGTMSGIAKEALKMSIQVKEILAFANEMEEISNDVRHLTDDVKVLSTRAQNRHRIEVLDWLSSNKYSERHREVCGKRVQGTGNWLLECGTFQAWIDQCQPALCCTGNPGVGKSVLTSLVIDHLKETFRSSQDVIAYYYFDHQRQDRKPQEALYGSLLRQVVSRQPAIPQAVQNLYETAQQDHTQALLSDLVSTFVATLSDLNRCVIVIDALDECPDRSQRQAILRTLFNIKSSALQIFVTCRPHLPEIDHHFAKATQIAIAANEGDIKVYCRLVLEKHEAGLDHIDEELKEQVVETIANQARGMFLLPVLHLQAVLEAMTRSEVRGYIKNLSSNLDQAFADTFDRINTQTQKRRDIAMRSLMWISRARRPLRLEELCQALATSNGDAEVDQDNLINPKMIIECCFGLVVTDEQTNTTRLVHSALQDYLQRPSRSIPANFNEESYITNILLTWLCFDDLDHPGHLKDSSPHSRKSTKMSCAYTSFDRYAAEHWSSHAGQASTDDIKDLALAFLKNLTKVNRARRRLTFYKIQSHTYEDLRIKDRKHTGLHIIAGAGLCQLIAILLDDGVSIDVVDHYGNTALHDAAEKGQAAAVAFLIKRGADPNVTNFNNLLPLDLAVSGSYSEAVMELLLSGAKVETRGLNGWSPLHKAADNGDTETTRLLLDSGASVHTASARGLIPLHRAAGKGHVEIMKLLVDSGSPSDTSTIDGWTPIHGASVAGQDEAVRFLLNINDGDIDKANEGGQTALHLACKSGHSQVVSVLLEYGANPLVKDSRGAIPLYIASKRGFMDVVEALLNQSQDCVDAQLTLKHKGNQTPAQGALSWAQWDVYALLTKRGKSTNPAALQTEHLPQMEDIKRLGSLSAGPDSDLHTEHSFSSLKKYLDPYSELSTLDSSLHVALLLNDEDSVRQILLEKDIDINSRGVGGRQPIHCASMVDNSNLIRLCLESGADARSPLTNGQTALHRTARIGSPETISILLAYGADIEAQDYWGWRPLHKAATNGSLATVESLLHRGADTEARTGDGWSVSVCARRAGRDDVVELLVSAREKREPYLAFPKIEDLNV